MTRHLRKPASDPQPLRFSAQEQAVVRRQSNRGAQKIGRRCLVVLSARVAGGKIIAGEGLTGRDRRRGLDAVGSAGGSSEH